MTLTLTYGDKMNPDVLTLGDLSRKAGLPEETLHLWMRAKLIRPAGYGDDKMPLFSPDAIDRIAHVRVLEGLGYDLEKIQKIVKKFGLPKEEVAAGQAIPVKKPSYLTVGDLAEKSGVSPRTIKHWEGMGIIEPDMRSEGGFRLYSQSYVFLCQLIRDLQLFGYTLEEIKSVSDDVRALMTMEADIEAFPPDEVEKKLGAMLQAIDKLFARMKLLEEGVDRWHDLLKKKRKDIMNIQARNAKRGAKVPRTRGADAGRGSHA